MQTMTQREALIEARALMLDAGVTRPDSPEGMAAYCEAIRARALEAAASLARGAAEYAGTAYGDELSADAWDYLAIAEAIRA